MSRLAYLVMLIALVPVALIIGSVLLLWVLEQIG